MPAYLVIEQQTVFVEYRVWADNEAEAKTKVNAWHHDPHPTEVEVNARETVHIEITQVDEVEEQ